MQKTKINSYNSTPFSASKQNLCPNAKFSTVSLLNKKPIKPFTPSMGTDSEFSLFNTINVLRPSQQNSATTKSRVDMQAILQNFDSKQPSKDPLSNRSYEYSKRSFLTLLGYALGKDNIKIEQAIDSCEQYEITSKDQLISILDQKQPSRQWPLPISNLLLTDLGSLKITQICDHLQNQQQLTPSQEQIIEFLLPRTHNCQSVKKEQLMDRYHEFKNKIDEKFNQVDQLVTIYTLTIQPKIRKIKDKVLLIKIQKRLKRYQKINAGNITYGELKQCLDLITLSEEQMLVLFKYFYFLENDRMMCIVDRRAAVKCSTCYKELFIKDALPFAKHAVSTFQLVQSENNNVINELLIDKDYLLTTMTAKNDEIGKLNNTIVLLQLQMEKRQRQQSELQRRQVEIVKNKYLGVINELREENQQKDYLISWYKQELQAAIDENRANTTLQSRQTIYQRVKKTAAKSYRSDIDY